MAGQSFRGLSYIPVDNVHDEDTTEGLGFNRRVFTIPGAHKYGNSRPVTDFQMLRTIAQGQFGTVYKVKDTANSEEYALKELKIPDSSPDSPQVLAQNFLRQIKNLKMIKHANIVNLKEVVVGKDIESNYLLLDLCAFSLEHVIDQVDAVFLQHFTIKNIMHQMLAGLHFIHRFNVVHRNLCPKNILFTETGILKIGDFGSTRTVSDVDMTPNHGLCGYRAPENLYGSNKYTKAVDIWAVGCIFAEMLRQKPLFRGSSDSDVVSSMLDILGSPSERHWPGFSDLPVPRLYCLKKQPYNRIQAVFSNQRLATVNYLMKFLQYNPASRPKIEDVIEDQYYEELPHGCSNQVLIVTLRMSGKL